MIVYVSTIVRWTRTAWPTPRMRWTAPHDGIPSTHTDSTFDAGVDDYEWSNTTW